MERICVSFRTAITAAVTKYGLPLLEPNLSNNGINELFQFRVLLMLEAYKNQDKNIQNIIRAIEYTVRYKPEALEAVVNLFEEYNGKSEEIIRGVVWSAAHLAYKKNENFDALVEMYLNYKNQDENIIKPITWVIGNTAWYKIEILNPLISMFSIYIKKPMRLRNEVIWAVLDINNILPMMDTDLEAVAKMFIAYQNKSENTIYGAALNIKKLALRGHYIDVSLVKKFTEELMTKIDNPENEIQEYIWFVGEQIAKL